MHCISIKTNFITLYLIYTNSVIRRAANNYKVLLRIQTKN